MNDPLVKQETMGFRAAMAIPFDKLEIMLYAWYAFCLVAFILAMMIARHLGNAPADIAPACVRFFLACTLPAYVTTFVARRVLLMKRAGDGASS